MTDITILSVFDDVIKSLEQDNGLSELDIEKYKSQPELFSKLSEIKKTLNKNFIPFKGTEEKIDILNDILLNYAQLDYTKKHGILNDDDLFNSVYVSTFLMGEHLNSTTVSKDYLEDIINSMEDILIVTDIEGVINSVNNNSSIVLKYDKDDLIGKSIKTLLPKEINVDELISLKSVKKNCELIAKDNSRLQVSLRVSPFVSGNNNVIGLIIIARDISKMIEYQNEIELHNFKIKETNEELKATNDRLKVSINKAEESDKLKSAFLANMSHEIRTPLNSIYGFAQILQQGIGGKEEQSKFFDHIINNTKNLLKIINDIIDLSKIETEQISLDLTNVDINNLLDELHSTLQPKIILDNSKNINFKFNKHLNINSLIETDRIRLSQILINLIGNAIKFTEKGSVEFGYGINEDKMLEFYVKDSGVGVSKEYQKVIFERFRQVDDGLTRTYGGNGLGLSISKALVELLGGDIWMESNEGEGSIFYFTIPYKEIKRVVENPIQNIFNTQENWEDKTILIVEDNSSSFLFLNAFLTHTKAKIVHAKSGRQAVDICKDNSEIDVVLMDIQLPEMNGYEATKQISSFNDKLPIIAQTANAMEGDRAKAFDAGCVDYISKPIDIDLLLKILRKYLN